MHETPSRDRGDGRATGQPQGLGSEAYLPVRRKLRDPRTPGRTAISAVAAGGSCIMRVNPCDLNLYIIPLLQKGGTFCSTQLLVLRYLPGPMGSATMDVDNSSHEGVPLSAARACPASSLTVHLSSRQSRYRGISASSVVKRSSARRAAGAPTSPMIHTASPRT